MVLYKLCAQRTIRPPLLTFTFESDSITGGGGQGQIKGGGGLTMCNICTPMLRAAHGLLHKVAGACLGITLPLAEAQDMDRLDGVAH